MISPTDVASGYVTISRVNPPSVVRAGGIEFVDLPLLRSVDPRQVGYLEQLVRLRPDSGWERVRAEVVQQRAIRRTLYNHVCELNARLTDNADSFVFPDPYSLLLWIWTFQLFDQVYTKPPGASWRKYYYRGEKRDYGATRFQPSLARADAPATARSRNIPARVRALIQNYPLNEAMLHSDALLTHHAHYLIGTLSCAQSLAIARHYGFPTPLIDVTVHPEIAMWFATNLTREEDIGIIGSWGVGARNREQMGDLAIIKVPALFSRVQLQNGYFICQKNGTTSQVSNLQLLRFRHCREIQPVQPTWLMSIGSTLSPSVTSPSILEDPLHLESAFKGRLPEKLPTSFPNRPTISDGQIEEIVRAAIVEFTVGAGRQGITEEGRRFCELHYPVLHSMTRHAPHHSYQEAETLFAKYRSGASWVEPFLMPLITLFRTIIASSLQDTDKTTTGMRLDTPVVLRIMAETVQRFDEHALNWPLNSWYELIETAD